MTPPPDVTAIKLAAAQHYGVQLQDLDSRYRGKSVALARHVAMFITRYKLQWSFPQLGRAFERDHTAVLNACKKLHRRFHSETQLRSDVQTICERLGFGRLMAQMPLPFDVGAPEDLKYVKRK